MNEPSPALVDHYAKLLSGLCEATRCDQEALLRSPGAEIIENASLKEMVRHYEKLLGLPYCHDGENYAAVRARVRHDLLALIEHSRGIPRKRPEFQQSLLDLCLRVYSLRHLLQALSPVAQGLSEWDAQE